MISGHHLIVVYGRKADTENLKKYYEKLDWETLKRTNEVQEKYDIFTEAYERGVKKYIPLYKSIERGKQDWFNTKCADAKKRETKHGKGGKEIRTK